MEEFYFITTEADNESLLSIFSDIANVVIALASLVFGGYIFRHQLQKDNSNDIKTDKLHQESINLQWFKELIVQPSLQIVYGYFSNLNQLREKINTLGLTDASRIELISFVKEESAGFRKDFISTLNIVSPNLNRDAQNIIDMLSDSITNNLDDESINLLDQDTYDEKISEMVQRSRNSFIAIIYNFKGAA